jgi:hypothetical protein
MGKYTEELNKKLLEDKDVKERYHRDQQNSFMTTFEWENVIDAQRLGKSMRENTSMFHFPFISRTLNLLQITRRSINAANRFEPLSNILTSEYGVMAAFINVFNILEFIPKGIAGLFIRLFTKKENPTPMQQHFADYFEKYGKDLETVPFYDHNYDGFRASLSAAYKTAAEKKSLSLTDRITYHWVNSELWFRSILSKPLSQKFHQPDNIIPATTDVLVRYRVNDVASKEEAMQALQQKLSQIKTSAQVEVVGSHLYVKEKNPEKPYMSTYALLSCPRYGAFIPTTTALQKEGIEFRKIAGNDYIQVKCDIRAESQAELNASQTALNKVKNSEPLYDYGDSIHPFYRTCLFKVPVKHLQNAASDLNDAHEKAKVTFIHNF